MRNGLNLSSSSSSSSSSMIIIMISIIISSIISIIISMVISIIIIVIICTPAPEAAVRRPRRLVRSSRRRSRPALSKIWLLWACVGLNFVAVEIWFVSAARPQPLSPAGFVPPKLTNNKHTNYTQLITTTTIVMMLIDIRK